MAYRRYSTRGRRRSGGYSRGRRRTRRRGVGRAQTVKIVVVGGGAGGAVPISATVAKKGVMPLRRRF